jgi:biotin transport system substrate-specific component
MSSVSPAVRRPVLADRVVPRSLATDAALVVAVPITGQTLAVLLVGGTLGATRGTLSMVLYAAVGMLGLPVFSAASSGVRVVLGPTGGYIVGFVLAAALTGWLAERKWDRKLLGAVGTYLAGSAVVFAVGLPWLGFSLRLDLNQTLLAGLYPFIIGGVIKAVIAAGVIRLGWFAADRKSR